MTLRVVGSPSPLAADPISYTVVGAVLLMTVFAATLIPAARAARIDPVTALRR